MQLFVPCKAGPLSLQGAPSYKTNLAVAWGSDIPACEGAKVGSVGILLALRDRTALGRDVPNSCGICMTHEAWIRYGHRCSGCCRPLNFSAQSPNNVIFTGSLFILMQPIEPRKKETHDIAYDREFLCCRMMLILGTLQPGGHFQSFLGFF